VPELEKAKNLHSCFQARQPASRESPLILLSPALWTKFDSEPTIKNLFFEATPGIEIHENRHPQSRSASISHFITRVQRSSSRLSPSFPLSVHGVVPNPYQNAFPVIGQFSSTLIGDAQSSARINAPLPR
jgi:hypothetical protein